MILRYAMQGRMICDGDFLAIAHFKTPHNWNKTIPVSTTWKDLHKRKKGTYNSQESAEKGRFEQSGDNCNVCVVYFFRSTTWSRRTASAATTRS